MYFVLYCCDFNSNIGLFLSAYEPTGLMCYLAKPEMVVCFFKVGHIKKLHFFSGYKLDLGYKLF